MPSLHRRMMYFCDLIYALPKVRDVGRTHWSIRDNQIGLIGPLHLVERNFRFSGTIPMDVAVVCRTDTHIAVAFRGTQAPERNASTAKSISIYRDWINNGEVLGDDNHAFPPGFVHDGFAESALGLLRGGNGVLQHLTHLLSDAGAPRSIIFTGHSKGGALAVLAAHHLKSNHAHMFDTLEVVTFGAARCGDNEFNGGYASLAIPTTRYESATDVVPLLPSGANLPTFIASALRHAGIMPPDIAGGFQPVGHRVPASVPSIIDWGTAYGPFILSPKSAIKEMIRAHSIAQGQAYDELVPG